MRTCDIEGGRPYFVERPWGRYAITMSIPPRIMMKVLFVDPWKRLSLQSHAHRDEHWIIAQGLGIVEVDGKEFPVSPGVVVHIPKGARHRVKNTAGYNLIISELWLGDDLSEDDITRYEDDFGRVGIG